MKLDLTISIVLYKSNVEKLQRVIESVLGTRLRFKLYLIDNSPSDALRFLIQPNVEYIYNGRNLGFGKAHNIALRKAILESKYHLVLNPDVYFDADVLERLYERMESDGTVGMISPKILYSNGSIQRLCKLLPTPMDLFGRRFLGGVKWVEKRNELYELHHSGYDKEMNIPYLSGCFMFLRTEIIPKVGLFDERIFMYIEDADLTRRIHKHYTTLFYPSVTIYHHYAKGSYKSMKLMLYNIHGAFIYFCKWGWLFDQERRMINKEVLNKYTNKS